MDFSIIKQGIAGLVKGLYPDVTIYSDAVQQGTDTPSFFIDHYSADGAQKLADTSSIDVGCVITYYPQDIRTNDEIEGVRFKLVQHLRRFETDNGWMTPRNVNASVVDMILTVTFTVRISTYAEPSDPMIEQAVQKTEIKE